MEERKIFLPGGGDKFGVLMRHMKVCCMHVIIENFPRRAEPTLCTASSSYLRCYFWDTAIFLHEIGQHESLDSLNKSDPRAGRIKL